MKVKTRTLYIKKKGKTTIHSYTTNRRFLSAVRACSGERFRVLVKYLDPKKEYGGVPSNDSGWYENKRELLRVAKAFLEK